MHCKKDALQSVEKEAKVRCRKLDNPRVNFSQIISRVRSDGLATIAVCGELDSSVDSSVIKIARLIFCTHMDIFIAVLIDYTCTTRLIDPAKSSLM